MASNGTRLIDAHPWVAAQWADDPELLHTINVSSPQKVLWRCADGHEFTDSPHIRIGKPQWKRGQIDACPYCLRHRYVVTFRCGHTREYRASSAEETPERHARAAEADCRRCRPQEEVYGSPEQKVAWRETHPLPSAGLVPGDVQQARNTVTSAIEEKVRETVRSAGYKVPKVKMAVLCHHPNPEFNVLSITPDIVLVEHKIAIEVDPLSNTRRYPTHTGAEDKDRARNGLMEAVGWTVIRLRLGGSEGSHIGSRDVVVESSGFTQAAQIALIEAIEDKIASRRAKVRVVKKGKTPTKAQRRSAVVNIGPNRYADDGHHFKWFPNPEASMPEPMRLCANGRYLYRSSLDEAGFVAEVGLHEVPREEWRDRLATFLEGFDLTGAGGTKWPWGDTLLVAAGSHHGSKIIIDDCEYRTSIDKAALYFTTNCDQIATWNADCIGTSDQTPIVSLAPEAVAIGYRIVAVELLRGYRGAYQRITITRQPADATA
jgi:hypothetical protein